MQVLVECCKNSCCSSQKSRNEKGNGYNTFNRNAENSSCFAIIVLNLFLSIIGYFLVPA